MAEQWKLGRKKIDDGAIMVIAKNDRAVRIEVGYGLEGALGDAVSKRIISETILPRFKPKQRKAVDVSKWGVKNVCDVVGGVDYKGGTYVLTFSILFRTIFFFYLCN